MDRGENVYRIIGIDPGTNKLGIAVLDIDLLTKQVCIRAAMTLSAQAAIDEDAFTAKSRGMRYAQIAYLSHALKSLFVNSEPNAVIHESPFMGKFPEAYQALSECIGAIRWAVDQYDRTVTIEPVDPPRAKQAVGAAVGRNQTKDDVRIAVLKLGLPCHPDVDLTILSEHAIDAIAVGYFKAKHVIARLT